MENKKVTMCQSCMMPFDKDPGVRESDRYCSYCFKNGKLCYEGNDLKEFQRVAYENMVRKGMNKFKAKFFTWMICFAPRWKNKKFMNKNKKIVLFVIVLILVIFLFIWQYKQKSYKSINLELETSMVNPYSKPGVIDINVSQILAEHVPGGIVVRGAWDRVDQGVFTPIPNSESFVRLKNSEGAPTPYYRAGNNIYMFKIDTDPEKQMKEKSSQGLDLPLPVAISGVDAATFIPGISTNLNLVSKDKFHVYVNGILVPEIDANTVIPVNHSTSYVFKDKNSVYYVGYRNGLYFKTSFDPVTYQILSEERDSYMYEKDKNSVFFGERKIDADPATFTVLNTPVLGQGKGASILYSYSKDKNHVYYSTETVTETVPGADPQTFVPIDTTGGVYTFYCGKDKNAIYSGTTTVSSISKCQGYTHGWD